MAEPFKIAGAQIDVALGEPEKNLKKMEAALEEASRGGAVLTVFPECALTGYCFESLDEAMPYGEPIPGAGTRYMAEACRRLGGYCIFGMLEVEEQRLFNACALVGPQGLVGAYRKIHLPHLGVDRFTTPGDRPFAVHPVDGLRVGMNICYDAAFPEAARVLALEGADLIVLPTNWPPAAQCTAEHIINARAIENHVYYQSVNRIGAERGCRFIGRSKICDPEGRILAEAAHENETILFAEIDVDHARNKRLVREPGKHEINRFADRRPEMYGRILSPVVEPQHGNRPQHRGEETGG